MTCFLSVLSLWFACLNHFRRKILPAGHERRTVYYYNQIRDATAVTTFNPTKLSHTTIHILNFALKIKNNTEQTAKGTAAVLNCIM